MVGYGFLVAAALVCGLQAVRTRKLLNSAIYLAGLSAVLSVIFYLTGAVYLAVFELSIGAGLVTVLFVFAISAAGEDPMPVKLSVPRPLAVGLTLISIFLLGWMSLPEGDEIALGVNPIGETLNAVLWHQRGLDLIVQVAQIFSGTLGIMGLLSEAKAPLSYPVADQISQQRVLELDAILQRSVEQEER